MLKNNKTKTFPSFHLTNLNPIPTNVHRLLVLLCPLSQQLLSTSGLRRSAEFRCKSLDSHDELRVYIQTVFDRLRQARPEHQDLSCIGPVHRFGFVQEPGKLCNVRR